MRDVCWQRRGFRWRPTLLACLVAGNAWANPPAFEAGNEAYASGDFAAARDHYQSLVEKGRYSANLFYNLGNAWARLEQPGRAILNYERALVLNPAHPEAAADVVLLRTRTGAQVMDRTWLRHLYPNIRMDYFAVAAALAVWLLCFAAAAAVLRKARRGMWIGVAAVAILLLAYSVPAIGWSLKFDRLAIVVAGEAIARSAPAGSGARAGTLPAGSEVRILADRGDWTYAELPGETRAWIPSSDIAGVRRPSS